jgi:hypothetical protein
MSDTDEIARLRALWCEEKSKSMTFYAEVERLRADLAQRTVEVAKANAERDEARREVCYGYGSQERAMLAAERRGWDCFDAPHATDGRVQNGGA